MDMDPLDSVVAEMYAEHRKVLSADATVAAIVLTFMYIDSMAWAGLPAHRSRVKQDDFESWVHQFLKTPQPNEYQYVGKDVYRARCSMLHTYSTQGRDSSAKAFGYHDGFPHRYNAGVDPNFVMISVPLFVDDFYRAVARFVKDARGRPDYTTVEQRFNVMFRNFPFKSEKA
jgi:hypothetical protein